MFHSRLMVVVAIGFVLGWGVLASAAVIPVPNGSFEDPDTAESTSTIPDWRGGGNWFIAEDGVHDIKGRGSVDFADGTAPDGSQYLAIDDQNNDKSLTTANSVHTIAAGEQFLLLVSAGNPTEEEMFGNVIAQLIRADDAGLSSGVVVLAEDVQPAVNVISNGAWTGQAGEPADLEVAYTAVAEDDGRFLGVRLIADDTNGYAGGQHDAAFDNVRLTLVPEPAALALLGFGALAMLRRRD